MYHPKELTMKVSLKLVSSWVFYRWERSSWVRVRVWTSLDRHFDVDGMVNFRTLVRYDRISLYIFRLLPTCQLLYVVPLRQRHLFDKGRTSSTKMLMFRDPVIFPVFYAVNGKMTPVFKALIPVGRVRMYHAAYFHCPTDNARLSFHNPCKPHL